MLPKIAVSPTERVVPEGPQGAPREAERSHESGEARREGFPVDPRGRAAVALSCRPSAADRDGGFGDNPVCLFRAPSLDGPLNRPHVLVSEAVGM